MEAGPAEERVDRGLQERGRNPQTPRRGVRAPAHDPARARGDSQEARRIALAVVIPDARGRGVIRNPCSNVELDSGPAEDDRRVYTFISRMYKPPENRSPT